jgi:hypothetical protein
MSEIIPGKLYLGDLAQANDITLLKSLGIKAIVSCGTFTHKSHPHP